MQKQKLKLNVFPDLRDRLKAYLCSSQGTRERYKELPQHNEPQQNTPGHFYGPLA